MSWHVVARVGVADKYEPAISPTQPRIHVSFESSGDPWAVSNNVLSHIAERSLAEQDGRRVVGIVYHI